MKKITTSVFLFICYFCSLEGSKIDIITDFWSDLPTQPSFDEHADLQVRILWMGLNHYASSYFAPDVKKVILMNEQAFPLEMPKKKMVLFQWEPDELNPSYSERFSRIYTYNDDKVDNRRFFKFYYPFLMPMVENSLEFDDKKLCTMVTRHWTPLRLQIVDFFSAKKDCQFEFYGTRSPSFETTMYRGPIQGSHSGKEKIKKLQKYKFCICFENCCIPGYITEKIFSCFAAGCVPIYLGAPNVSDYIPKECFIDYRDFDNDEDLYQFLQSMTKENYQKYVHDISVYLISEKAELFSLSQFEKTIYEIATSGD